MQPVMILSIFDLWLSELNKSLSYVVISPYQFTIGDTTSLSEYTGGGIATELKEPKYLNFVSLLSIADFASSSCFNTFTGSLFHFNSEMFSE